MTRTSDSPLYIDRYRLLELVGVGSSASVYRAFDEDADTEVAVKVLADNYSQVPDLRQRFLEEAALLMAIRSPAVATVFGQGETDAGQPYMVLELADRGDLGRRVEEFRLGREEGSRAPGRTDLLVLAEHLTVALSVLHDAGIVHRDVTPGNVLIATSSEVGSQAVEHSLLLGPDERYLLADLGFAKDLHFASGLTAGGGTRGFAAPEQQEEIAVVDHRADIYGATALIRWMTEGGDLGDRLAGFITTGMAANPQDRHPSMAEWSDELVHALNRRSPPHTPGVHSLASHPVAADRSFRRQYVAGGALLLSAVAMAAWFASDGFGSLGSLATDSMATSSSESVASPSTELASTEQTASIGGSTASEASVSTVATSQTETPATTTETPATTTPESTPSTPATETITPASTNSASTTPVSSTPATSTPEPATTQTSTGETTIRETTTTTVDPLFEGSPRAFFESPFDESLIAGDLQLVGSARYRAGVDGVSLVIRREQDTRYWHHSTQSFESEWIRFVVPVSPSGAPEVSWSYSVDAKRLPPGRYFIRVWAIGSDVNDPVSDQRYFTVAD